MLPIYSVIHNLPPLYRVGKLWITLDLSLYRKSLFKSTVDTLHSRPTLEKPFPFLALTSQARIIGINNRDLKTFTVDLTVTKRLRPLIPPDKIVVSESGIKNRSDMEKLRQWGVDAVLIGESLMSASDIAAKMKELL